MNLDFVYALREIEREKGVSLELLLEALEAALLSAYKKNFGSPQNARVDISPDTGEVRIFVRKTVVEQVHDPKDEMSLEEAQAKFPGAKVGDELEVEVTPKEFGRIAAQTAKQVVVQRIREAERSLIYEEYANREDDIVTGSVQRQEMRTVYLDLGKAEAVLPPSEQIPTEVYRQGDRFKAYIVEVKKTTKGPQIIVSRTHPGLLKRLFELEVPEVREGLVEIKSIAREAGARSKVAVRTRDERIDPVGACVGPRGIRVQAVVSELRGEKIDVVKWSERPDEFIANALSPAKVTAVIIDEENKIARVMVPEHQLSLAIGKEGQNARLAARLTGWKIDIRSDSQAELEVRGREMIEEDTAADVCGLPAEEGQAGADQNSTDAGNVSGD